MLDRIYRSSIVPRIERLTLFPAQIFLEFKDPKLSAINRVTVLLFRALHGVVIQLSTAVITELCIELIEGC